MLNHSIFPAGATHIAVAISGGADSMTLALLLHAWCAEHGGRLIALHVDHNIRDVSAQEAKQVQVWMEARDIPCHILTVTENLRDAPNLQEAAREARYALMTAWCREHAVKHICVAHHADDQAETVLMRLARGSGVDGLAAMRPVSLRDGVTILRPLLGVSKDALVAYLQNHNQSWLEDASNHTDAYARNRMRKLLPSLAKEGITSSRLADAANHLARASDYLQAMTEAWITEHDCMAHEAYGVLPKVPFSMLHEELALRVMRRVLHEISPSPKALRFEHMQPLVQALQNGQDTARTLHGCQIIPHKEHYLIAREVAAMQTSDASDRWDGRFAITLPQGYEVKALGAQGLKIMREAKAAPAFPATLLHTLPALFHLEALIAVPHIDYYAQTCDDLGDWIAYLPYALR